MASNKLIKKVYIDGNILVKNGTFIGKNICFCANESYKVDADKIIEASELQDGIFEITENYGSPYIEYYARGGFTFCEKNGAFIYSKKIYDDLLSRIHKQLNEVRELLNVSLPKATLYPLFYREQHSAVMSIMENFLYCMVLRELIYDKEELFHNIRTYPNINLFQKLKSHITDSDDDLYIFLTGYITDFVYHRISQVRNLYDLIFRIDITDYIKDFEEEIIKRNNIVHRNGQELNGESMPISKEEVADFIEKVQNATTKIWDAIKSKS